jgi:hypothetical protein
MRRFGVSVVRTHERQYAWRGGAGPWLSRRRWPGRAAEVKIVGLVEQLIDGCLKAREGPTGRLSIFVEGSDEEQPSFTAALERCVAANEGWKW